MDMRLAEEPCWCLLMTTLVLSGILYFLTQSVMSSDVGWFCYPVVNIGVVLPVPLTKFFRNKIQDQRLVKELILQAKRFGGKEAAERGIIDKTAPSKSLLEEGIAYAQSLADKGKDRRTYGGLKKSLYNDIYNLLTSDSTIHQPIRFTDSKL